MAKVPKSPMCVSFDADCRAVKILVVYDCFDSGLQAIQIYRHLTDTLGQDLRFEIDFWRFEILGVPSVADRAAAEAIEADLILVATDESLGVMPTAVRLWMGKWIEKKVDQDCALVHVSGRSGLREDDTSPTCQFLRQVAARGRMTFIAKPIREGAPSHDSMRELGSHRRFHGTTGLRDSSKSRELILNSSIHEQEQTNTFPYSARHGAAKAESQ